MEWRASEARAEADVHRLNTGDESYIYVTAHLTDSSGGGGGGGVYRPVDRVRRRPSASS